MKIRKCRWRNILRRLLGAGCFLVSILVCTGFFIIRRVDEPFATLKTGDLLLFSRIENNTADYFLVNNQIAQYIDIENTATGKEKCGTFELTDEFIVRAEMEKKWLMCVEDGFMLVDKGQIRGSIIARLQLRDF